MADVNSGPLVSTSPIGGLTINAGQTQTDSGWLWTRNVDEGVPGLNNGQMATNGLNGGSYWIGGIDLNGNGSVGTYTLHDNGTWSMQFEPNEGMVLDSDPTRLPEEYYFYFNGIPAHPGIGTGPVEFGDINIVAPYSTIPEASTSTLFTIGIENGFPIITITNFPDAIALQIQLTEDVLSTNWHTVTNFISQYTNWTDSTATGDWRNLFYRLAE